MAGSAKRERQLARERYERQQARRAQRVARRRRSQQVGAVAVAVLLITLGVVVLGQRAGNDAVEAAGAGAKPTRRAATPAPSPSPSPSPSGAASTPSTGCTYTKVGTASRNVPLPTYDPSKAASYRTPFTVDLATSVGPITIAMAAGKAPCTTNSFRSLAQAGYFDGTTCHRLTTANIFVLQCGDPTGSGSGGPGYQFGVENPPTNQRYPAGTVAMARTSAPGTNGSQFFIVYRDTTLPDPNGYSIFGRVTRGLDLVRKVAAAGVTGGGSDGAPATTVTIRRASVGKD